jgi:RNA polymerase sigma-70 factor (ECF subfamily)
MVEQDWLATQFEANRPHLRSVAYRMLGSLAESDDAVQESWLRLARTDTSAVENLTGWLTTVTSRVCLDMLRSRKSRREEPMEAAPGAPSAAAKGADPQEEALLADSVGLAMLVVLDRLAPAERVAFVLHDMFDVAFDEIAGVLGRSSTAVRQLASRGRRRVRGTTTLPGPDFTRQREVVEAFLAAARGGDLETLVSLLDPDVVFGGDRPAGGAAAFPGEVRGATKVARLYSGRAHLARAAVINGSVGFVVAPLGKLFLAVVPTVVDGKITALEIVAAPERLEALELNVLEV